MKDDYPFDGDESQKFDWYYKEQWFDEFFLPLGAGLLIAVFIVLPIVVAITYFFGD